MSKVADNKWMTPEVENLFQAILQLNNTEEARAFMRDLLTEQELLEFSMRWKVAQMLDSGISYSKIEQETSMSSTTIARIAKWLNNGMGGYRLMLAKLHHNSHSSPHSREM